jgi:hypothetical protein
LSVGLSFGLENPTIGILLATAIGLQNMPEGLAVALPLSREGYRKGRAVAYATLSGLVEPVAGLIGVVAVTDISALLPYGLAFASGAMLSMLSHVTVYTGENTETAKGDSGVHLSEARCGSALWPNHPQDMHPFGESAYQRCPTPGVNPFASKPLRP